MKLKFLLLLIIFNINFISAEPINLAKIKAQNLSKDLNLTDDQIDKLIPIFQADIDDIKNYNKNNPEGKVPVELMQDLMNIRINRIEAIKNILNETQFNSFLIAEAVSKKNQLTVFVKDRIGLDSIQILLVDSISYYLTTYLHTMANIVNEEKLKKMNPVISKYMILLTALLNDNQKLELDVCRNEIQKFIEIQIAGYIEIQIEDEKNTGRDKYHGQKKQ